jgi:hypothetical protein
MRKIALILLAGALALSAVEWEVQQVTDESGLPAKQSILTLDRYEVPHILYYANDADLEVNVLKYASPTYGSWLIFDVDEVSQYRALSFSFDFTPSNAVIIAYTQVDHSGNLDLYLACDSSAIFDITNLTDDHLNQLDPVVHVGSDQMVRIVYREQNDDGFNIRYGWRGPEGFQSESIKDSMSTHLRGFDFVLDSENVPHVFYQADDYDLWYATRFGEADWIHESLEIKGNQPSVAFDGEGFFHIGYENLNDIYYATDKSGTWQEEQVADNTTGDQNWVHPSLALDPEWTPHITWYSWTAPFHAFTNEVWYSSRTGGSWSDRDSLPPNQAKVFGQVNPFHIDSEGYGHICYAIYDTVYYVKTTEPLHTGIVEGPAQRTHLGLEVTGSTIHFSLTEASTLRLDLYDASGRLVDNLASGFYPEGQNSIPINSAGLSAGVYFVRVETEGQSTSVKFILMY